MRLASPDLVRRALAGHAAIGLIAGAILYLLCLSGTLIVVHEEWQRWEQPHVAEMTAISPDAVERGIATVLAGEAGLEKTHHLYVRMPDADLPRAVVTTDHGAHYLNGDGSIAAPEAHAWTEFLIGLHYYLHMPPILGLTIVGAFGVMMAALILGGVIAHPRILRDAFRLRAKGGGQLATTDWHNRLGVWTLPFGLAVAITGALLGLATILATGMAARWYDGDREAVYAPIFGAEPAADATPAPLPAVAPALAHMARAFPDIHTTYVVVHDPATRGQHVQLLGDHPRRLIFGDYYRYDAAGRFEGTGGMSDGEIGRQLAASVYKLHFGSFGGPPVKLAYVLLGAATTVVAGTGMSIWLAKRRKRGRASPRLETFWAGILWGGPTLIALAYVLRTAIGPEAPMTALFWLGLAGFVCLAMLWPHPRALATALRRLLGALLAGIGLVHAMTMIDDPRPAILLLDALLVVGGAALLAIGLRLRRSQDRADPIAAPAE